MALAQRRPTEVVHHSDPDSQYTSIAFGQRCRDAGVRPSMGSVGDCYDNALCESFFATLECELLDRKRFPTQAAARLAAFEFLEAAPAPFGARLSQSGRVRAAAGGGGGGRRGGRRPSWGLARVADAPRASPAHPRRGVAGDELKGVPVHGTGAAPA
jgi:transposase InsO family protein